MPVIQLGICKRRWEELSVENITSGEETYDLKSDPWWVPLKSLHGTDENPKWVPFQGGHCYSKRQEDIVVNSRVIKADLAAGSFPVTNIKWFFKVNQFGAPGWCNRRVSALLVRHWEVESWLCQSNPWPGYKCAKLAMLFEWDGWHYSLCCQSAILTNCVHLGARMQKEAGDEQQLEHLRWLAKHI